MVRFIGAVLGRCQHLFLPPSPQRSAQTIADNSEWAHGIAPQLGDLPRLQRMHLVPNREIEIAKSGVRGARSSAVKPMAAIGDLVLWSSTGASNAEGHPRAEIRATARHASRRP